MLVFRWASIYCTGGHNSLTHWITDWNGRLTISHVWQFSHYLPFILSDGNYLCGHHDHNSQSGHPSQNGYSGQFGHSGQSYQSGHPGGFGHHGWCSHPGGLVSLVTLVSLVIQVSHISLVNNVSLVSPVSLVSLVSLATLCMILQLALLHNFLFYLAHLWTDFQSCFIILYLCIVHICLFVCHDDNDTRMHAPPRVAGKMSAPPRKKEALPRPALWKLPKPVGRSGAKLISIH